MRPAALKQRVRRRILSRSGRLARLWLFRDPRRAPVHRAAVEVARDAGIGDVVMCTPALRELKRRNPHGLIRFYTNFPELVRGLPYIDQVLPYASRPADAIFLEYTDIVPSEVHITRLLGDRLGVAVTDTHPDCMVDQGVLASYRAAWADLPRPHLLVLRRASRFTPNKDWPAHSWDALLTDLAKTATIIEIGEPDPSAWLAPRTVDLRGATSVAQLAAVVAAADIHVGPVSGPLHIAAAVGTPSVAIIGGYEDPRNAQYDGNIALYTKLACSPCWLRDACPHGLACLHAISVDRVRREIDGIWARLERTSPAPILTV